MRYFLLIFIILGFSCQPERENMEIEVIKSTLLEVIGTLYYLDIPPPPPRKAFLPDSSYLMVDRQFVEVFDGSKWISNDSLMIADSIRRVAKQKVKYDSIVNAFYTFDWNKWKIDSIEWAASLDKPQPSKRIVIQVFD